MNFEDVALPTGTRITNDGYLVGDVRCARTGVQQYHARELGLSQDVVINVYRPEEVVFDTASLRTFAGKPITIGHPPEAVTADNWKKYAVGDVGNEIARDGQFVRVPFKLMDSGAIGDVMRGVRQISMGYTTDIEFVDGTAPDGTPYQAVQKGPIVINHLAVVPRARGGDQLRVGDAANTWGVAPFIEDGEDKMPENNTLRSVVVDGLQVNTTDQGAQAISKLIGERDTARTALDSAQRDHTAAIAKKDEEIGSLKVQLQQAKDAAPKPADLDRMAAERGELIASVKSIDSKIDPVGKSDADLRRAAVASKLGDAAVKDANDDTVKGMFTAVLATHKSTDQFRQHMQAAPTNTNDRQPEDRGQGAYEKRLKDAWKMTAKEG